jgi:hypothetical protein
MRNLLALIGLVVVVGGGVGWYMGWFKLSYTRGTDGTIEIKTDVNTKKVETDSTTFFKNATSVVGNQIDKSGQDPKTPAPPAAIGTTPGPVAPGQNPTVTPVPPTPSVPPGLPIVPPPPPGPVGPGPVNLVPPM